MTKCHCTQQTKRRIHAGNSNLWIDTCEHCSEAWFDGGEVRMLLDMFKENPAKEALVLAVAKYDKEKELEELDARSLPLYIAAATFAGFKGIDAIRIMLYITKILERLLGIRLDTNKK